MQEKSKRIDRVSRVIEASAARIYAALVDPAAIVAWRPPKGMTARIHLFEPRVGGRYRMALFYGGGDGGRGKSTDASDVVNGRFAELVPDRLMVEQVEFLSEDPAFAGTMTITTRLRPLPDGSTEVTVACEDVPPGIAPADHEQGMRSSLDNLADFTER